MVTKTCECGHTAHEHNQAFIQGQPQSKGPVSGKPSGWWTNEDIMAVEGWGCDDPHCACTCFKLKA